MLAAECKSVRALMYYLVATRWGTCPVITDVLPIEKAKLRLLFQKPPEIYAQVMKDLQEAAPCPSQAKPWTRPTKEDLFSQAAVKFLLAKTYMQLAGYPINQTDNWQKAADVLAEFVPKGKERSMGLTYCPILVMYTTRRMTRIKNQSSK